MNREAALAFVRSEGSRVERARLTCLLDNSPASPHVVRDLLADQRADGGWAPFWASEYSSLDATCFGLARAEQLGLTPSDDACAKAARFLAQRQRPDGSWEEDESIASVVPPWVAPGRVASRLYLTANCGYWLAILSGEGTGPRAAGRFLETHLDESGRLPASWQAHWLAGSLWHRLNWQAAARRVLARVDRHLSDLPASNLAWLISALHGVGVSASHPLLGRAATLLERRQASDGRWVSEDGPEWDAHATVEALRALRLCRRF